MVRLCIIGIALCLPLLVGCKKDADATSTTTSPPPGAAAFQDSGGQLKNSRTAPELPNP